MGQEMLSVALCTVKPIDRCSTNHKILLARSNSNKALARIYYTTILLAALDRILLLLVDHFNNSNRLSSKLSSKHNNKRSNNKKLYQDCNKPSHSVFLKAIKCLELQLWDKVGNSLY